MILRILAACVFSVAFVMPAAPQDPETPEQEARDVEAIKGILAELCAAIGSGDPDRVKALASAERQEVVEPGSGWDTPFHRLLEFVEEESLSLELGEGEFRFLKGEEKAVRECYWEGPVTL